MLEAFKKGLNIMHLSQELQFIQPDLPWSRRPELLTYKVLT